MGLITPESSLSVVVLPAPLGPRKATNSPCSTSRSMPRTACDLAILAVEQARERRPAGLLSSDRRGRTSPAADFDDGHRSGLIIGVRSMAGQAACGQRPHAPTIRAAWHGERRFAWHTWTLSTPTQRTLSSGRPCRGLIAWNAKFGRYAVPNLTVILDRGTGARCIVASIRAGAGRGPTCSRTSCFMPDKVLAGEWWRLITFLFDSADRRICCSRFSSGTCST